MYKSFHILKSCFTGNYLTVCSDKVIVSTKSETNYKFKKLQN